MFVRLGLRCSLRLTIVTIGTIHSRTRRSAHDLAEIDPRRSRVVELRFFGGLSIEETAEVLKVSTTTVERDWTIAKAWLYKTLQSK